MNSVQDNRSLNGGCSSDQQQNLTYPSNQQVSYIRLTAHHVDADAVSYVVQVQSGMCHDRNGTPIQEHSNSAPPSPITSFHHNHAVSGSGVEVVRHVDPDSGVTTGFQASVLQHQFEQFKMVNNFGEPESMQMVSYNKSCELLLTSGGMMQLQGSTGHSSSSSASSSTGGLYMSTAGTHSLIQSDKVMGQDFVMTSNSQSFCRTSDAGAHYATRNLPLSASSIMSSSSVPTLYSKSVISCAPSQYNSHLPQRPVLHSPTSDSIPEIVLTGMVAAAHCFAFPNHMSPEPLSDSDALLRGDFSKELGSAMGSFDASDLFSSDSFKSELPMDPIDFDGLQILTELTESEERMERS